MLGREQTGCESKGAVPEPPAASLWTYEKQALKSTKLEQWLCCTATAQNRQKTKKTNIFMCFTLKSI